ncbi:MAG: FeoB-associated Cys-rich membrane protein [Oscillibacter sp.]|nr:FeoB-associated Cys-rich membrane protein [Oscillibacter sp.]
MLAYIVSHMGYIVVTLVLILIVAAVIGQMVREKKTGKGGCGCGCKGCANAPYCHPQNVSDAHVSGAPEI